MRLQRDLAIMNGAVVIRWGASIPGREAKGLEVFGQLDTCRQDQPVCASLEIRPSQMGKRVYERVGFVATDFGIREYAWRKS